MSWGRSSETRFIYCSTLNYRAINLLRALGPAAISHSPPREFRGQAALVLSCFTRTCLSWHLTSIARGFTATGCWQRDLTLHVGFLRRSMPRRGAALALPGTAAPPLVTAPAAVFLPLLTSCTWKGCSQTSALFCTDGVGRLEVFWLFQKPTPLKQLVLI